jgi:hypothetical protein
MSDKEELLRLWVLCPNCSKWIPTSKTRPANQEFVFIAYDKTHCIGCNNAHLTSQMAQDWRKDEKQ